MLDSYIENLSDKNCRGVLGISSKHHAVGFIVVSSYRCFIVCNRASGRINIITIRMAVMCLLAWQARGVFHVNAVQCTQREVNATRTRDNVSVCQASRDAPAAAAATGTSVL